MNRQQKSEIVELLKNNFSKSASFLVDFRGLTVGQMQVLRKELRGKGGTLKVAKARLMKRAIEGMEEAEEFSPLLRGQVGIVFAEQEPSAVAKVLALFSKKNEALTLIAGCLESQVLGKDAVVRIAELPSKEVLLAQVCGAVQAPISGLASVLNILILRLLWSLKQVAEKKQE